MDYGSETVIPRAGNREMMRGPWIAPYLIFDILIWERPIKKLKRMNDTVPQNIISVLSTAYVNRR